ncbi:conserved protein of unknown function [Methylacidimicrobium sp. AP8]|uniref:hypothetical protein n=1 Tax=Methylacidimicrobium sp. AP8 TaxID=2730359 RepID=UPI0018C01A9F|nr:hypothetical protein [Methylacidimicrobium sp. AP8]CAB4243979.1 conserved protein of unknown function [Methylacidimicrobium sp. AP8]
MAISKERCFCWLRIAALTLLVVLLGAGGTGALWLNGFVRGKRFAGYAADLIERATGCQGTFEPFAFAGFGLATKGYQGKGAPGSHFASIQAKNIRIEIDPLALLRLSLEVRRASIVRLKILLQKASAEEAAAPGSPGGIGREVASVLPQRFRVSHLSVRWPAELGGGGMADEIDLRGERSEEGIALRARGGHVRVAELPELVLTEAHGLLAGRTVRVESAELHLRSAPEALIAGTGKLALFPTESTDLSWQIRAVPTKAVLPGPWQHRVTGTIHGFGKVVAKGAEPAEARGDLFLDDGSLHGIPFLIAIDSLLRVSALQDLTLSRAQCHVEGKGDWLRITDIDVQSGDAMALNGWAEVVGKRVSGVLNVGVRSDLAQLAPRVDVGLFQPGPGGYFWTTVRLSGTSDNVQEDLTPRIDWALKKSVPTPIERKGERILRRAVPKRP